MSLCTIAANVGLAAFLVRALGFRGLALATSLAALANGALLLMLLLRGELHGINGGPLMRTLLKVTAAAVVMAVVATAVEQLAVTMVGGEGLGARAVRLALAIGSGLAALAFSATVLRIQEFGDALALVRARLFPRQGD